MMANSILRAFRNISKSISESVNPKFNANNMHLLAEYDNIIADDAKRVEAFKKKIRGFIESKARLQQMTCTYDIPKDLRHYKKDIISWLEDAGFAVIDEGEYHPAFDGSIGISWRLWHMDEH